MTNDPSRTTKPRDLGDRLPARAQEGLGTSTGLAATTVSDQKAKAEPTRSTMSPNDGREASLVLRYKKPPVDQFDFDDRHDTRATENDEMARRYAALRKDRRKDDWHYLAMNLIVFIVGMALYLTGFIVVSRQFPHLSPRQVAQIVGLAFVAAGGGVAFRLARRVLKRRHIR